MLEGSPTHKQPASAQRAYSKVLVNNLTLAKLVRGWVQQTHQMWHMSVLTQTAPFPQKSSWPTRKAPYISPQPDPTDIHMLQPSFIPWQISKLCLLFGLYLSNSQHAPPSLLHATTPAVHPVVCIYLATYTLTHSMRQPEPHSDLVPQYHSAQDQAASIPASLL